MQARLAVNGKDHERRPCRGLSDPGQMASLATVSDSTLEESAVIFSPGSWPAAAGGGTNGHHWNAADFDSREPPAAGMHLEARSHRVGPSQWWRQPFTEE